MSKKTANYGAAQERAAITRKINRMRKTARWKFERFALLHLRGWIKTRADRASKRAGGLGRK
jgi:hypothetical protein